MPVEMIYEADGICALRISGILKRSEFAAQQNALARKIDIGSKPRLLVILENFQGWERGADWNDLDFMISHGGKISKIAIVGDPRWETLALAFAGAGVRRAPVKFFPANELEQARGWLGGQNHRRRTDLRGRDMLGFDQTPAGLGLWRIH